MLEKVLANFLSFSTYNKVFKLGWDTVPTEVALIAMIAAESFWRITSLWAVSVTIFKFLSEMTLA